MTQVATEQLLTVGVSREPDDSGYMEARACVGPPVDVQDRMEEHPIAFVIHGLTWDIARRVMDEINELMRIHTSARTLDEDEMRGCVREKLKTLLEATGLEITVDEYEYGLVSVSVGDSMGDGNQNDRWGLAA
jgi:hypothetical protein